MRSAVKVLVAVGALGLIAPAGAAQAKQTRGVVLGASRSHHSLRIATRPRTVRSFHYSGRLDRRIHPGARVSLNARGVRARKIRYRGRAHKVQVYGRMLHRSGAGAVFTLPDGRPFSVGGSRGRAQARAAQNVSISLEGLQPGQTVLLTLTFSGSGDIAIAIKLVNPPADGGDTSGGDQSGGDESGDDSGDASDDGCDGCTWDDESGDEGDTGDGDWPDSCGSPDAVTGKVVGINRRDGLLTISQSWADGDQVLGATADQLAHVHYSDVVLARFDPDTDALSDVSIVSSSVSTPDPGVHSASGTVFRVNGDAGQFSILLHDRNARITFDAPCWITDQLWTSEDVTVVYHDDASGDPVADTADADDGGDY